MHLRLYQKEYIEQVQQAFETHTAILLQMPTGTGKTVVFCELAKSFCKRSNSRVLILAHRAELINQISERIKHLGLSPGIIKSGYKLNDDSQIQIASVQTLCRKDKIEFLS